MMNFLYNVAMYALSGGVRIHAIFNAKSAQAVKGRKNWRDELKKKISSLPKSEKRVWFHASSLGEFEQGRPVMEALKKDNPDIQIILTFFSPSGYTVRHDYSGADVVCYLPWDTPRASRDFVDIVRPTQVVFIKYEFWANILTEVHSRHIPLYLISARFKENSIFFKIYGGFFRSLLGMFTHIFTQDKKSDDLLRVLGLENHSLAGDTRFDRVVDILSSDNSLPFMEAFTQGNKVIVVGSAWEDDYRVMAHVINAIKTPKLKYVVAPHEMNYAAISAFRSELKVPSVLYSQLSSDALLGSKVLILDTIGILTKVYSYAHISYVGGGWTPTGIHNVLEPAVFARPVVCGPRYTMYNEAVGMKEKGGLLVIKDENEAEDVFSSLLMDDKKYESVAVSAGAFVKENSGATSAICRELFSVVNK